VKRRKRKMKKRLYYCFPASAILELFEDGTFAQTIADQVGLNRTTVQRWRNEKCLLSPYQADGIAIKLGKHPSAIWTNWFDLPEYTEQQRKEILQCPPMNATANEMKSSQPNTDDGATTCPPPTSTSYSASTTDKSPSH